MASETKVNVMRESLRLISRIVVEMTNGTVSKKPVSRDEVDGWAMRICEILGRDLEIPLRNCDTYGTKDEAREAFQKLRGHRVMADVSLWDDRDEIERLFDWLFAEAKKGASDE
ncbi:MAG: hypothetical protein K6G94_01815 [Kiritimatiellae bacterium]|nr:hypothetical protein [Kiritimatiellia bacterium]